MMSHPLSRTATLVATAALGLSAVTGHAAPSPAGPAAAPGAAPTCAPEPTHPLHEMRGTWVASVANIDWPSRPGLSPEQAQAELLAWYDDAVASGLNSVFVQVRPTADTFWPSDLEPSSHWITGEQGADFGGWDPMAFAVDEAHRRGLDFHAWFNPYRITLTGTDPSVLAEDHPARVHPEWVVAYGGKLYYDPGVPAAREHTEAVIMEAVERYDIDGVHFDDYFYPYPVGTLEFPDQETFETYGAGFEDIGDWRRDNVTTLIQNLDEQIQATKPWVAFGVSPFGVWRNSSTDPEGSATTAGAQTYDDLYADTRLWTQEGMVDYILPQIYWAIGFAPAAYDVLVPWWDEVAEGSGTALWIGQATYKVGTSTQSPEWSDPAEMTRHLDLNEEYANVTGDVFFSAKDVRADRLDHWALLQAEHYARPALPPVTDAGSAPAAVAPLGVSVEAVDGGTEVRWNQRGPAADSAVYRVRDVDAPGRSGDLDACAAVSADNLVAVVGHGTTTWVDPDGRPGDVYVVTTLADDNTQSAPSRPSRTL